MKNTLADLNNHLFAQLERLNDEELTQEDLNAEIERSKAISGIAKNIVENAKVSLQAMQLANNGDVSTKTCTKMLGLKEGGDND